MRKFIKKISRKALMSLIILLVLLMFTPYLIPITKPSEVLIYPYGDSYYKVIDGFNVHYRMIKPEGFTKGIVLIHGFGGSVFSWRNQENILREENIFTVMIDLPGFGNSDRKSGFIHTSSNRSAFVWDLLSEIEKENNMDVDFKWVLAGHSMGAEVVDQMTSSKPEKVDSVIYIDGSVNMERKNLAIADFPPVKRWIEVLTKHVIINEKNISRFLKSAYGRQPEQSEIYGYYLPLKIDGTERILAELLKNHDRQEDFDEPAGNVFRAAIWGSEDTWVSVENIDYLRSRYPELKVFIVENAYHCPMETHYAEFNHYLEQLLQ